MKTISVKKPEVSAAGWKSAAADILLIEDNAGDARLAQEAFKQARVANRLHIVSSGEAALDFLSRREPFSQAPRPDLILLDLNLPRKSGTEVLEEIKSDLALRPIPILVLTMSRAPEDVARAYASGANGYIVKPVDVEEFFRTVRIIEDFWFSLAQLPH